MSKMEEVHGVDVSWTHQPNKGESLAVGGYAKVKGSRKQVRLDEEDEES